MFDDIPYEVREFIKRNVSSVGHLEVLMLLKRDPSRSWTADSLSAELRTNPSYATQQLRELLDFGLVAKIDDAFCCSQEPEVLNQLTQLEAVYRLRRTTVINFIYSQPMDRIRDFANAFRLKKD
ncbi:MAG: hypothetical protein AB7G93_22705 [Bdellovibrionales bacterium]